MTASIGILNVGAGDTKLTFDKRNPVETIRAGRIVTDMLRRGYALLVEVPDGSGGTVTTRVKGFDPETAEYIIADFDPLSAEPASAPREGAESPLHVGIAAAVRAKINEGLREISDHAQGKQGEEGTAGPAGSQDPQPRAPTKRGRKPGGRRVAADSTGGIAVARSAGG